MLESDKIPVKLQQFIAVYVLDQKKKKTLMIVIPQKGEKSVQIQFKKVKSKWIDFAKSPLKVIHENVSVWVHMQQSITAATKAKSCLCSCINRPHSADKQTSPDNGISDRDKIFSVNSQFLWLQKGHISTGHTTDFCMWRCFTEEISMCFAQGKATQLEDVNFFYCLILLFVLNKNNGSLIFILCSVLVTEAIQCLC